MTKRLLSLALAIILAIGVTPALNIQSSAASADYDAKKSLKYAKKNWDNGVGLCAEYVSRCLNAGGVDVFNPTVKPLYKDLKNTYGKAYKLKLTGGSSGRINMEENAGKLQAGDPIFYKCNHCEEFTHVVLCNGANDDGYSQDYAHNNAHNGYKTTYTYRHCGGDSWTLYSIRMYDENHLFGSKSSVEAPKVSSAENGKNGIIIKWNKTKDADKYVVYRKTDTSSWKKLGVPITNSYTDTTAENSVKYTYTVRAVDGKKKSQYYAGESVTCIGIPTLGKCLFNDSYIKVNWDSVSSADGYYIYRKAVNGKSWKKIATVKGGSKKYYKDKKANSGTEYVYTVRAYDGSEKGCYNDDGTLGILIKTPASLTATNEENVGITITYAQTAGAEGYNIYRKTAGEEWVQLCTVTGADVLTYTDSTVEIGKEYTYTVSAIHGEFESKYNKTGVSCVNEQPSEQPNAGDTLTLNK